MNILKIGDRYINLDNVTNISPVNEQFAGEPGVLQIEYIGRNSEDWGSEWVDGEDAIALESWLNANSTLISNDPTDYMDVAAARRTVFSY